MTSIHLLSDTELHFALVSFAGREREIQLQIIHHLLEVSRRRLHLSMGYSSLHDYCVKELKYPAATAQRRITSMELLRDLPVDVAEKVKEKVSIGRLNWTTLSQVQTFVRAEKRETGKVYTVEDKCELLATLEGCSTREAEKVLASISPIAVLPRERERPVTAEHTELKLVADSELMALLNRAKELAPAQAMGSTANVLKWALGKMLKQVDPCAKAKAEKKAAKLGIEMAPERKLSPAPAPAPVRKLSPAPAPAPVREPQVALAPENPAALAPPPSTLMPKSRYIPAPTRRQVWKTDQARCSYIAQSGLRCTQRSRLQIDHLHEYAKGGTHEASNLRLLCLAHHRLRDFKS